MQLARPSALPRNARQHINVVLGRASRKQPVLRVSLIFATHSSAVSANRDGKAPRLRHVAPVTPSGDGMRSCAGSSGGAAEGSACAGGWPCDRSEGSPEKGRWIPRCHPQSLRRVARTLLPSAPRAPSSPPRSRTPHRAPAPRARGFEGISERLSFRCSARTPPPLASSMREHWRGRPSGSATGPKRGAEADPKLDPHRIRRARSCSKVGREWLLVCVCVRGSRLPQPCDVEATPA